MDCSSAPSEQRCRALPLFAGTERRGNRAAERLGIFGGIKRIIRNLLSEFLQIFLCDDVLLLAARGERQKYFRKRFQVVAIIGGLGDLLHAKLLVAVDAAEPKKKSRGAGK